MDVNVSIGSILTATDEEFFSLYTKKVSEPKITVYESIKSQYKFLTRCRSLRQIARKNFESLVRRNIDPLRIFERLQCVMEPADTPRVSYVIDNIRIDIQNRNSESGCFLCDHKIKNLRHFNLFDINSQASAEFDENVLHLIEKHEFYMIDPLILCRVFNIGDMETSLSLSYDSSNDTISDDKIRPEIGNILTATLDEVKATYDYASPKSTLTEFLELHQERKELAKKDCKMLQFLGVTHEQLHNRLLQIIKESNQNQLYRVTLEDKVALSLDQCMFCPYSEGSSPIIRIENLKSGKNIKIQQFALHLLGKHHYFARQGAKNYRIDPELACEVLGLGKLIIIQKA